MELKTYILQTSRKLLTTALKFSIGNNKVCKLEMTTSVMYLLGNDNHLVEVEVKADVNNLGWVYRDDIEFLILDLNQNTKMIDFKTVRKIVESKAKEHGKVYSDSPKLYHIRKDEHGGAYFYLHENDITDA